MSHILIISDNDIINDIYSFNLELYVGASSTIKNSVEDAIALMEQTPRLDFIVCLSEIGENEEAAKEIYYFLNEKNISIPLIIIGVPIGLPEDKVTIIPFGKNVKRLIQAAAYILNLSARDMAEKVVPDYYPVPIKLFYNISELICDVFLLSDENKTKEYIQVWKKGDSCENSIRNYIDKGVHSLYIPSLFRLKFINSITERIEQGLQSPEKLSTEKKVELIEQGIEVIADELMISEEVSTSLVNISKTCLTAVKGVIQGCPRLRALLESLTGNKTRYVYSHAMLATYISHHVIENISWGGQGQKEKLSFVFFFHDLFLVPIYNKYPDLKYEEEMLFHSHLTDKEKSYILEHAKKASLIVQNFPRAPIGADAIVLQHHGMNNGEGFAVKFKDDIAPLAKVVVISEAYVEELFKYFEEGLQGSSIPHKDILNNLYERFTWASYKKIIKTLETLKV